MRLVHENGLSFFRFDNLAGLPGIRHGFFPRRGGVSRGPFESLNVARGLGDAPGDVAENRRRVGRALGGGSLVFVRQVHGTDVLVHAAAGPPPEVGAGGTGDAVVTDLAGRNLVIQVADCQAVMLCDAERRVVANVHAGWRGSIRDVVGRTVAVMTARFGSRPGAIFAGVGPSLGPCCAEFVNYREEIPEKFWAYRGAGDRFDFWALSTDQLRRAGVPATHIELSGLCTRCRGDLFFSYRGEGTTGRMAAVIGLADGARR